uniref:CWF19-like protein 1 n=1 Tax=Corethrella appendiculata TaxID=1370023 RepID=U5EW12_9DIPT
MDNKQKILICGDVDGKFGQFFNRIESVNKKSGPFEACLCVGNFFGNNTNELEPYKNRTKIITIPTYILGPTNSELSKQYENISDGEICPNLVYLGKRGIFTTSNGLKIAYLSGLESNSDDDSKLESHEFNTNDCVNVRNSCFVCKSNMGDYRGVDILLTSQWPFGIQESTEEKQSSKLISWLANEIKPRYHFCALNGIYYEPPPYRSSADKHTELELATRFIGLANVGNTEKQKYIYALSIVPVEKMRLIELIQKTTNELPSPYTQINYSERKGLASNRELTSSNDQYFYDMNSYDNNRKRRHNNNKRDSQGGGNKRPVFDQEKCWFCLGSAGSEEKHLIISVGEHFYLALAKGPINDEHILILSITHIQSAALLNIDQWEELEKFKQALRLYYKDRDQAALFYERNYKTGHLQINVIGIDENVKWKIQHVVDDKAEEHNLQMEKITKLASAKQLPENRPYFIIELPDEDSCSITQQMKGFPLHFGREIICNENLMNCDEKIDWRQCNLGKEEEIDAVNRFRESFKPYDFTL